MNEAIFPFKNSEFSTPHVFEQQICLNTHGFGDAAHMQFTVDCCEQQRPVFKTDEFNWYFTRGEINAYWGAERHIINNDGKSMLTECCLDTISVEFRLEFHCTRIGDGIHRKCCNGVSRTCVRPWNNEDIFGSEWTPPIFAVVEEVHGQTGCIRLTKIVYPQPNSEGCVGGRNVWNSCHRPRQIAQH